MKEEKKTIIYQLMPRWFTNSNAQCVPNGTIKQNGSGKFNEIDETRLRSIKSLGATHVWYTGIIEHATATDYSRQGTTMTCVLTLQLMLSSEWPNLRHWWLVPTRRG